LVRALPAIQQAAGLRDQLVSFTLLGISCVVFFLASAAGPLFGHGKGSTVVLLAIAFAVMIVLVIYAVAVRPWAARRMARRLDRLHPPALTTMELDNSGLRIGDADTQMAFSWRQVHGVVDVSDGIAIVAGYSGMHVPDAAFGSEKEKSDVVAFIKDRAKPLLSR
jgi:hypothetical protein